MDMAEEKRDTPRVPAPGPITGEVTVYEPMTIMDLSRRGAQIETRFALHLDSLHDFRLSLGDRSVVIKGRIVHCQIGDIRDGAVLYRTGVEFVDPPEHALTAIRSFIDAQTAEAHAPLVVIDAELADDTDPL